MRQTIGMENGDGNRGATGFERGAAAAGAPSTGGFTLVELLAVVGILGLLIAILLPTIGGVRERAYRVKCANNLRQLGVALTLYSSAQPDRAFPRTQFDPKKDKMLLDNAGYGVAEPFGGRGYVGENNVPASLFVLFRVQRLDPGIFVCPSTEAQPGWVTQDRRTSSNWQKYTDNVSYSLAAPFPSPSGTKTGFIWKNNYKAEFALMADINPGTRGGASPPNNSEGPAHTAPPGKMAAANSNNHRNQGQNVLYGDGHVQFQTTPYCGMPRAGGFNDNIYTAGTGDRGTTDESAMPLDDKDSVLLPTDDPGGK
jgi:prepilin-type N-terminal cleavage/methylation domain-containing protein/prepilin-type processing-associated H-X9-DG protein